jgi:hypothetical protein
MRERVKETTDYIKSVVGEFPEFDTIEEIVSEISERKESYIYLEKLLLLNKE